MRATADSDVTITEKRLLRRAVQEERGRRWRSPEEPDSGGVS